MGIVKVYNPFLCNNIIHTKNKATPNKRCRRLKPYRIFLCTILLQIKTV
ncbi:hypothetical protein HMPREF3233_01309 [Veillonella atypica]|uniref:Uncharacterized protein n=1 Tax=Veillonella atypica TaxID=39777 RepID=A0A133S425_9FIRM|nr:hypothetical protein HMPREF3233_01309 [Veillonella atypica]